MHIAICDDNVADRKQLERLLKRESDKRASSTGIIYADSFGNASALLANPIPNPADITESFTCSNTSPLRLGR